jgi:hypothetical protein
VFPFQVCIQVVYQVSTKLQEQLKTEETGFLKMANGAAGYNLIICIGHFIILYSG